MSMESLTQVGVHDGGYDCKRYGKNHLVSDLVDNMIQRWEAGERPLAEEYFQLHPEVEEDAEAAIRLIYEEVCLREDHGEAVALEEMVRRFPKWRSQLEVLLDCHHLLEIPKSPPLPAIDETLGEYIILAELGRGVQGAVFLASQPALGERFVVLKVSPRTGQEHLVLARLQHTHIMPLYAVQEDVKRNVRTLCMPYFGGASLNHVLEEMREIPLQQRTGKEIVSALDRCAVKALSESAIGALPSTATTASEPARRLLAGFSYVQAMCWLGACLADALQYAHDRGLVHLDIKPSNVLLAADAQPMLLDFHIAQKPILPGEAIPEGLGGTPAYMSPEQRMAMASLRDGHSLEVAVDGRSDIYSLGLFLYDVLGGEVPLKRYRSVPPLGKCNPQVSTGLSDIIKKCMAGNPSDRYASAADLAHDLRCHLRDLPLRGVRNRSVRERWHKWRRRRPHALSLAILGITVLLLTSALGLFAWNQIKSQRSDVEASLDEGQLQLKSQSFAAAANTFSRGLSLAESLPGDNALAIKLDRNLRLAQRGVAADQLHALVERLRFFYGASSLPRGDSQSLAARWRQVWEKRVRFNEPDVEKLPEELESRLSMDLLDLGLLWADVCVRLAPADSADAARREALQVLAETEKTFGASNVLCRQREIYARDLGDTHLAEVSAACLAQHPAKTAWDYYALGRTLLGAQDLEGASQALEKAVEQQPQGFWPNFYQGICAYRQRRFNDAAAAFQVCLALAPNSAECYYNHALAEAAAGKTARAMHDYGRALELDPSLSDAALNRGMLQFAEKRYHEAVADLSYALAHGSDPAPTYYNLALVQLELKDFVAARTSLDKSLAADAAYPPSLGIRERVGRP